MSHKAYAFDIDANLFHTECMVFLERGNGSKKQRIEIPERELKAKLEEGWSFPNNDPEECYRSMRLGNGRLTQDLFDALDAGAYGPSWNRFKHANVQASPIGIITARGHPIEDVKGAHRALLYEAFNSEEQEEFLENMEFRLRSPFLSFPKGVETFLDMNYYAACANKSYSDSLGIPFSTSSSHKKVLSFEQFIAHVVALNQQKKTNPYRKGLKIGFSDDSLDNLSAMEEAIQKQFILSYPNITFALYNTNDPSFVKKTVYTSKK